jgi:hypothetical protein
LLPGKSFCFHCGQSIVSQNISQTQPNKLIRRIEQKGKDFEEYFELTASDNAIKELAPVIKNQIVSPPARIHSPLNFDNSIQSPEVELENTSEIDSQELPQLPAQAPQIQKLNPADCPTSMYFERNGEFLVATRKDFKGSNWAEQQRRFILLYTSAYYHYYGKPVPSKEHFKTAAQKASILDPTNFPKYLNESVQRFISELEEGYKLNHDGEKEVNQIIGYIDDENIKQGHPYWSRNTNSGTKRQRLSKDDKNKLKEWAQEDFDLGQLEVRDIEKPRDYAMISLWLITIKLKKAQTVRPTEAYNFFKEKFKTISVSPQGFSRAMSNSNNKKYFSESAGRYYLTSEAEKQVERWIAGEPLSSSADDMEI